jgi:hypothetical protein
MQDRSRRLLQFLSMIVLVMFSPVAFSQDTGASLLGSVRDGGGATVKGATVSATNVATNARTVQT